MNAIVILILSLVAFASSRVPVTSGPSVSDRCEELGPSVYCADTLLTKECDMEGICNEYSRKSPCEKGPEVYCESTDTAQSCDKVAYCLTWPDDSVTAIEIERIQLERIQKSFPPGYGTF